jgi:hypothetical protein
MRTLLALVLLATGPAIAAEKHGTIFGLDSVGEGNTAIGGYAGVAELGATLVRGLRDTQELVFTLQARRGLDSYSYGVDTSQSVGGWLLLPTFGLRDGIAAGLFRGRAELTVGAGVLTPRTEQAGAPSRSYATVQGRARISGGIAGEKGALALFGEAAGGTRTRIDGPASDQLNPSVDWLSGISLEARFGNGAVGLEVGLANGRDLGLAPHSGDPWSFRLRVGGAIAL